MKKIESLETSAKVENKPESREADLLDAALRFLSSIRLGIYLLIILVIVSFIGTIIPQKPNTSPETLQRMFAPANLVLLDKLGILDLFHAWWFKLLLTLLGLNIVFASIDRISTAWRFIQRPARVLAEPVIRAQQQHAEIHFDATPKEVEQRILKKFKETVGNSAVSEKDGRKILFAQRHVYARLAAYGIHLSLLVIFAGGLIGLQFGYRGRITLNEGQSTSKVILFDTAQSIVEASSEPRYIEREMGFTLRHEKAEVVFNSPQEASLLRREDIQSPGVVKNWYCTLSAWENGVKRQTDVVAVNQPMTYRGFRFFQSGFDFAEGFRQFTFQVRSKDERGGIRNTVYKIGKGESFTLPEMGLELTPGRSGLMPDAEIPYVVLSVKSNDGKSPQQMPVFDETTTQKMRAGSSNAQLQTRLPNGREIFLVDAIPEFATTLQVSRDPGVTTVWAGCILLMLGLTAAFYFAHQRVWAMLIPEEEGTRVVLGGDTNKNRSGFANKFEQMVKELRENS